MEEHPEYALRGLEMSRAQDFEDEFMDFLERLEKEAKEVK